MRSSTNSGISRVAARRARIVVLAAEGLENEEICATLDVDPNKAQEQAGATQPWLRPSWHTIFVRGA
jgi:hypothetical protein